jgi:phage terminase Nu1 subunit (DNA packaging protein)
MFMKSNRKDSIPGKRTAPKARSSDVKATLQAWATALGMEHRTLSVRMVKAGFQTPKHALIPAGQVYVALLGDKDAERIRLLKAQAEAQEFKNRETSGRLIDVDVLKQWCAQWFGGVRAAIDAAPDTISREWADKVFVPAVTKIAKDIAEK